MKKNLRIISVAAAALLAVAPVVSTAIPVNADTAVNVGSSTGTGANTTNTNTQAPQNKPYFTYNNEIIGESTQSNPLGNVVRTTVSFKSGDKVSDLFSKISTLELSDTFSRSFLKRSNTLLSLEIGRSFSGKSVLVRTISGVYLNDSFGILFVNILKESPIACRLWQKYIHSPLKLHTCGPY